MTTNKGVNRTFLITFLIYVGGSFLWSLIGKRFVDSFYVDIAVSQLLVCVPPFVYLKISGTKTGKLIPYKKIRISDAPVSYTHLDVYKRQLRNSRNTGIWGIHRLCKFQLFGICI